MSALKKIDYLTEKKYLKYELSSPIKHEFIEGQIYAMAGASENHNLISGNLFFNLRNKSQGNQCKVFSSDMKLKIPTTASYYYPDVMLICQDSEKDDEYYKHQPCLIVEVLSKSTQTTDKREKLLAYQKISSLQYYLMVYSTQKKVEYFKRNKKGAWQKAFLEQNEILTVQCESYQAILSLDSIYEDIKFK